MTIIVQTIASASARDYDWLRASVAGWLHRTDLEAVIPDFVVFAEQRINKYLADRLIERVPALADSGGTNWLIEQHSGLYLAATMCEATQYTRDTAEQQKWEIKYATTIGELDLANQDSGPLVLPNPSS